MGGRTGVLIASPEPIPEETRRAIEGSGCRILAEARSWSEYTSLAELNHPSVVVLDERLEGGRGLDLAAKVKGPAVVLMLQGVDEGRLKKALRAGARDFVSLPPSPRALAEAISGAAAEADRPQGDGPRKLTVTVFATKGGVGKSTIACNLAVALARRSGRRVAIADFDLEFGCQASMLGLRPRRTLADPGPVEEALTPTALPNLRLLAAPPTPEYADQVGSPSELLDSLRDLSDLVVVDTSSSFSETNLAIFDASDVILLVTTPDIPSLNNMAKGLEILLDRLGYGRDRVKVLLNRSNSTAGLRIEDISAALGASISFCVPSDGRRAIYAANTGKPFMISGGRAPIVKAIDSLARWVIALGDGLPFPSGRKGIFPAILRGRR